MFHLRNTVNVRIIRQIYTTKTKAKNLQSPKLDTVKEKCLVPLKPVQTKIDLKLLPPDTVIDAQTIALLERLSLVDCANKEGIKILEDAIKFADQILQVDTKGVEPLITVLEDRPLELRDDKVTEGDCREDILSNATLKEEEYLVAPPGNIPLETRENLLHDEKFEKSVKIPAQ